MVKNDYLCGGCGSINEYVGKSGEKPKICLGCGADGNNLELQISAPNIKGSRKSGHSSEKNPGIDLEEIDPRKLRYIGSSLILSIETGPPKEHLH